MIPKNEPLPPKHPEAQPMPPIDKEREVGSFPIQPGEDPFGDYLIQMCGSATPEEVAKFKANIYEGANRQIAHDLDRMKKAAKRLKTGDES